MKMYQFLTLAALLVAGFAAAQPAPPAALVNGEAIPLSEVERIAAFIIKEKFTLTPPTASQQQEVRREVLDMLIEDLLFRQFLAKQAPVVPQSELDAEFAKFTAKLTEKGQNLQDFHRETGQSETDLRTDLRTMLQWAAYVKNVVQDAELKTYFNANKEFFDQVTVRASHILKQLPDNASETDKQAARQKLKEIRDEIVAGKLDFAEAAKKESQCQASASSGGDVGFFPRKFLFAESFAQPAFALQVGQVSEVVETPYGLHLIKVTDRKVGRTAVYEQIKDEVRQFYVEELRLTLLLAEQEKAKIEIKMP